LSEEPKKACDETAAAVRVYCPKCRRPGVLNGMHAVQCVACKTLWVVGDRRMIGLSYA
jgi:hypothetical protein